MSSLKKSLMFIILSMIVTFSIGCGAKPSFEKNMKEFRPIKIGLVADAQLNDLLIDQSSKGFWSTVFGNNTDKRPITKLADRMSKVALRPPALDLASASMFRLGLEAVRDNDIILVLGDLLNNGCSSEFKRAEDVIADFYKLENSPPVFVLIGNHDYLSAGVSPIKENRRGTCSGDPLTKKQLAILFGALNTQAFGRLDSKDWTYFDSVKTHKSLDGCGDIEDKQDRQKNCFLASVLKHESVEILLTDTSDFQGLWFGLFSNTILRAARAGISDSQKRFFKETLGGRLPNTTPFRVIASHFDLPAFEFGSVFKNVGVTDLMTSAELTRMLWVSAHTHDPPRLKKVLYKSTPAIEEYRIGSTTDGHKFKKKVKGARYYPPSASSVVVKDRQTRSVANVKLSDGIDCEKVDSALLEFAEGAKWEALVKLGDKFTTVAEVVGADRSYKTRAWKDGMRITAHENAATFVTIISKTVKLDDFVNVDTTRIKDTKFFVEVCLGLAATRSENKNPL